MMTYFFICCCAFVQISVITLLLKNRKSRQITEKICKTVQTSLLRCIISSATNLGDLKNIYILECMSYSILPISHNQNTISYIINLTCQMKHSQNRFWLTTNFQLLP